MLSSNVWHKKCDFSSLIGDTFQRAESATLISSLEPDISAIKGLMTPINMVSI